MLKLMGKKYLQFYGDFFVYLNLCIRVSVVMIGMRSGWMINIINVFCMLYVIIFSGNSHKQYI